MSAGAAEPALPRFVRPLAERARSGRGVLVDRIVRAPVGPAEPVRRSAVLLLIAGEELEGAQVVLQERGHGLRSQPGQFGLPGGRREEQDADDIATALREAHEEIGLRPASVTVLGAFAPVALPHRAQLVTPVLAWAPRAPQVGVVDPIEVERVVWAGLQGPGSIADPARRRRGALAGREVGVAYDLPDDVLVWGFTAALIEATAQGLGARTAPPREVLEIPAHRRR